jgi:hypothetical protein
LRAEEAVVDAVAHGLEDMQRLLEEEAAKFRSLCLKANWCETVFEAKPQLLLQLILMLETDATFGSPFGIILCCILHYV